MIKVAEGIYRGEGLDSHDVTSWAKAGIKTVLNLDDFIFRIGAEKSECELFGLNFISLPMDEFTKPSITQLCKAAQIIQDAEKPLLIHCKHDRDRTGYVIVAYRRLVQGWSFWKAYKECIEHGHKWLFYLYWIPSLMGLKG